MSKEVMLSFSQILTRKQGINTSEEGKALLDTLFICFYNLFPQLSLSVSEMLYTQREFTATVPY